MHGICADFKRVGGGSAVFRAAPAPRYGGAPVFSTNVLK
jgi:hypothetical protein